MRKKTPIACSADKLRCAACLQPIRSLYVGEGSFIFYVCRAKRRRAGTDLTHRCDTYLYISMDEGQALVMPLDGQTAADALMRQLNEAARRRVRQGGLNQDSNSNLKAA